MDRKWIALLGLAAATGCTRPASPSSSTAPRARPPVVATFTGEADLLRGTLTVTSVPVAPEAALVALPEGRSGANQAGTVELSTAPETVRAVAGGCGAVGDFEGEITIRSRFAGASLQNVYAEILTMTPSGYEACNGDAPALGLSGTNGLWSYGTLAAAGSTGDAASRVWKFKLPSNTTNFTFVGRVMAEGALLPCSGALGLPGAPAAVLPSLGAPRAVASGDLNGDGRLDVVVAYAGDASTSVSVLLGNGDGTFQAPVGYTVGTDPRAVALADVDGDGQLDIVTANRLSHSISVLAGRGDGTFAAAVGKSTGAPSYPTTLAVADLTGDAYPEIAVGVSAGTLIIPNASGTLGTAVTAATGSPSSLLLADLDGDGRRDLAALVYDSSSTYAYVLRARLNDGAGAFPTQVQYAIGGSPNVVALSAGDLGGDGRPELIVADAYQPVAGAATAVVVYPNDGHGAFGTPVRYAVAGVAQALAVHDVSGDGRADIVVTASDRGTASVLVSDGTGAALPEASYAAVQSPAVVLAGDFTRDGREDLLVVSDTHRFASVLANAGGGVFPVRFAGETGTTIDSIPAAVITEDLDGDWVEDLLVTHNDSTLGTYTLAVRHGIGGGAFDAPVTYALPGPAGPVATADLDHDGLPDVVVAAGSNVTVFRGGLGGVLSGPVSYSLGDWNGVTAVALADLNGDGWPDLVVGASRAELAVFLNRGDGTFPSTPTAYPISYAPKHLAVADFSHDGSPDVVVNTGSAALVRLRNAGNGTFVVIGTQYLARTPVALAAADLNGDGWPDLALADYDSQRRLAVLINSATAGTVAFGTATVYPVTFGAFTGLAAGDLNGDGFPDLVASTAYGAAGVYINAGTGALQAMQVYPVTLPGTAGVALADLNRDFRPDALVLESRPMAVPGRVVTAVSACLP